MPSTSICTQCAVSFSPTAGARGLYCSTNCTIQHQTLLKREKGAQVRAVREQEYMKEPSLCAQCNHPLSYKKRKNRFCSSRCAATFNNTGRVRSTESKQKISGIIRELISQGKIPTPVKKYGEDHPRWKGGPKFRDRAICATCDTMLTGSQKKYCATCRADIIAQKKPISPKINWRHKCLMCENIIENSNKTCSPACRAERNRQAASENLRKNRHKYVGPHQRSWMEKTFVEWLEKHNILKGIYGYWDQVHFKHKSNGKTKNGWADFVFVSRKLIIELDGTHHRTRKELDATRDAHLSSRRGYQVFRVTHAEYQKGVKIHEICDLLGIIMEKPTQ